jgi:aspartyl-tRNA(Asn)/glutamyl-tRNA(Gln) amidotransferase subunit C
MLPKDENGDTMAITRTDVLHVAKLARLELAEDEIERMIRDLGSILGYVTLLGELDTDSVSPTAHVAVEHAPCRADELEPCLPTDQALEQAPRHADGAFAVPGFLDE